MKINFNKELLNTIHAVRDYRRFLSSYHVHLLGEDQFDKDAEAEKFFYSLPITGGLPKSKACYEAITSYPTGSLNWIDSILEDDLKNYEFGF